MSNADLQGKVSFINFWFPPAGCISEMPKVIKMSKDYQGKKTSKSSDIAQPIDPLESIDQLRQKIRLPFTVMFDADKAAAQAFGTQGLPDFFPDQ